MFVKRNNNIYLSLPNEMSDSDGICNKDAVCVKLRSQRNKRMAHEAGRNMQNCVVCQSILMLLAMWEL